MSNFAADIEEVAGDEPIEAIVIGAFGWNGYGEDEIERLLPAKRGVVLSWEEARPMLDYDYSTGFGAPECDAIWVWTPTRVLFVSTYDGATGVDAVPRNPQAGEPDMPGGG